MRNRTGESSKLGGASLSVALNGNNTLLRRVACWHGVRISLPDQDPCQTALQKLRSWGSITKCSCEWRRRSTTPLQTLAWGSLPNHDLCKTALTFPWRFSWKRHSTTPLRTLHRVRNFRAMMDVILH